MTENDNTSEKATGAEQDATPSADPKEAMRQALEAKQAKQSAGEDHMSGRKVAGGPHGAPVAKRTFRRKSGG